MVRSTRGVTLILCVQAFRRRQFRLASFWRAAAAAAIASPPRIGVEARLTLRDKAKGPVGRRSSRRTSVSGSDRGSINSLDVPAPKCSPITLLRSRVFARSRKRALVDPAWSA
jgi:hypothetical protein